jgi:hypothetical protein
MNWLPSDHPDRTRLEAVGLSKLDAEQARAVERHVSHCDNCCQALESLANDSLVAALRPAASTSGAATVPAGSGADAGRQTPSDGAPPPDLAQHPRYRVVALLGAGGMGAVYKTEHRLMKRTVALKVISRALTDRPAAVERFRREVKAAARLNHPNVVTVHHADQVGGTHFLVMEYVEGTSLARLVEAHGPLPAARAYDYAR